MIVGGSSAPYPGAVGELAFLFGPERLADALPAPGDWRPYPTVADREAWRAAEPGLAGRTQAEAEARRGAPWPPLPASLFADFRRTGDRQRFQRPYFERRSRLGALVVAECLGGDGRFLDDVVDGVWAICEESSWSVPAHTFSVRHPRSPLPDVDRPLVDLFGAETGATLAWTAHLLRPCLEGDLAVVLERVRQEVRRRLLVPYRCVDEWRWLRGREPGRGPNNWNPWIHANLLTATLLLEDDPHLRVALAARMVRGVDAFLEGYADDGGCDEGPAYWWRAAGSLFDFLETLRSATGGRLDGFADAEARQRNRGELLFRFGRRVGDPEMVAHALAMRDHGSLRGHPESRDLGRLLPALFDREYADAPAVQAPLVRDAWLPGVQVLACRQEAGTTAGLFLAAKGGHNGESHNHNDVGSFVVALDGVPVLVDAGVGVYTARTFGPERYGIWTMQSAYHNLPVIDGVQQGAGPDHRAGATTCEVGDAVTWLRLDLAAAYPAEARIRRWLRTLRLERTGAGRVVLVDDWELEAEPGGLALHLLSWPPARLREPGRLAFEAGGRPLLVEYDPGLFAVRTEEIRIDDERLAASWGDALHRTVLDVRRPPAAGSWTLRAGPGQVIG